MRRHSLAPSMRHSDVGSTQEPAIQFAIVTCCLSAAIAAAGATIDNYVSFANGMVGPGRHGIDVPLVEVSKPPLHQWEHSSSR